MLELREISEENRSERDLSMNQPTYEQLAASQMKVGLALLDAQCEVIWANSQFEPIRSCFESDGMEVLKEVSQLVAQLTAQPMTEEMVFFEIDWDAKRWQLGIKPLHNKEFPDVVALLEVRGTASGSLHEQSAIRPNHHWDPLTGVLSRGSFEKELACWLTAAERQPFALLFLDLDRFKSINDQYGHVEGDACLREIGSRLSNALRSGDLVGRYGGDEFCLLIAGVSTEQDLLPLTERLQKAVQKQLALPGGETQIGVSLGWAFSRQGATSLDLIHEADRAMYARKRVSTK